MHSQESYVCIIDGLGSESDHRGMSPGYEALQALCIHPAKGVDVCSCVSQHMSHVWQHSICMSVCTLHVSMHFACQYARHALAPADRVMAKENIRGIIHIYRERESE